VLLIPADELAWNVLSWDAQTSTTSGESVVRDRLASDADPMLGFLPPPDIYVEDTLGDFD
jgi:hypothetical protein